MGRYTQIPSGRPARGWRSSGSPSCPLALARPFVQTARAPSEALPERACCQALSARADLGESRSRESANCPLANQLGSRPTLTEGNLGEKGGASASSRRARQSKRPAGPFLRRALERAQNQNSEVHRMTAVRKVRSHRRPIGLTVLLLALVGVLVFAFAASSTQPPRQHVRDRNVDAEHPARREPEGRHGRQSRLGQRQRAPAGRPTVRRGRRLVRAGHEGGHARPDRSWTAASRRRRAT